MERELPRRPESQLAVHTFARPMVVGAVCVLLFNDYVLKRVAPGVVSGKLSDIAGLFILPLILVALYQGMARRLRCRLHDGSQRVLRSAIAVSATGFVFVKSSQFGAHVYSNSLSAVQWPLRQLVAWFTNSPSPEFEQVIVRADLTDLVALPVLAATWRVATRTCRAPAKDDRASTRDRALRRPADAM